jgi:alpha-galactosidase
MRRLSAVVSILVTALAVTLARPATPAAALDNGLARTPPMGFNDWNAFGCGVSEQLIKDTADLFVSSGLQAAGYRYVNIDDCWMTRTRDPQTGRLVPDPAKFPDGIAGLLQPVRRVAGGVHPAVHRDARRAGQDRPADRVLDQRVGHHPAVDLGRRRGQPVAHHG